MSTKTRLVRTTPLSERLKAYLNPLDFLLWLSEELNSGDWEEAVESWSLVWGAAVNILFLVARGYTGRRVADDVFGDGPGVGRIGGYVAGLLVWTLGGLSIINAVYTFTRKRRYRLFETAMSTAPPPSASLRRVKLDSSPAASSPLKVLADILPQVTSPRTDDSPASGTIDEVWELAVWNPTPLSLKLFALFSPGHVLIYYLFLPLAPLDARPSVTIATALLLAALLSAQLAFLIKHFTQQARDNMLIQKEVQHEYDAKFVHPSLYKPVRDVGVQCSEATTSTPAQTREVLTYTPVTYVNRGFKVHPSPQYAAHLPQDVPETLGDVERVRMARSPAVFSPASTYSSPLKATPLGRAAASRALFAGPGGSRPGTAASVGVGGDGGSLGVFSHAHSPLKRAGMGMSGMAGSSPLKEARRRSPVKGGMDARRF